MENDLKARSSEVAKKWEFDFSMEQPLDQPVFEKFMSWEPVSAGIPEQTRPKLQLQAKPRMCIPMKSMATENLFGTSLQPRSDSTAFGATSATDSTVASSMFGGSLVGLNCSGGKASLVDFGSCLSVGFRTSIVRKNLAGRRATVPVRETSHESEISSLNDRGSNLDEEGKVNPIEPTFKQNKCYSDVKVDEQLFKDSEELVENS